MRKVTLTLALLLAVAAFSGAHAQSLQDTINQATSQANQALQDAGLGNIDVGSLVNSILGGSGSGSSDSGSGSSDSGSSDSSSNDSGSSDSGANGFGFGFGNIDIGQAQKCGEALNSEDYTKKSEDCSMAYEQNPTAICPDACKDMWAAIPQECLNFYQDYSGQYFDWLKEYCGVDVGSNSGPSTPSTPSDTPANDTPSNDGPIFSTTDEPSMDSDAPAMGPGPAMAPAPAPAA